MHAPIRSGFDWYRIVEELGTTPAHRSLPSRAKCPICREGDARIYHETTSPVPVMDCTGCGFSGTLLQLAAKIWDQPAESTVERLKDAKVLNNASLARLRSRDVRVFEKQRQAMAAFTRTAFQRDRLMVTRQAAAQMKRLNLRHETGMSWSSGGMPAVVGVASRAEAEAALADKQLMFPREHPGSGQRLFPPPWADMLVVPFRDSPARICSLTLISGHTRHFFDGKDIGLYSHEIQDLPRGVAAHPYTLAHRQCGPVLCLADLPLYLNLHAKHFALKPEPLPIACYRKDECPSMPWPMLSGGDLVFMATEMTSSLIWRAIQHDAKVVKGGPNVLTAAEYMKRRDPEQFVQYKLRAARPWQDALVQIASKSTDEQLVDWFSELSLTPAEVSELVDRAPAKITSRLSRILEESNQNKAIPINNGYMEARHNGWYYREPGKERQLVTDAPFRIHSVMHAEGRTSLEIGVRYRGKPHRFVCAKTDLDKRPLETVQKLVVATGAGMPTFQPDWQRYAMHIAMQLSNPGYFTTPTVMGYDPESRKFSAPGRQVCGETGRTIDIPNMGVQYPGWQMELPEPDGHHLTALLTGRRYRSTSALVAAIVGSVFQSKHIGVAPVICVYGSAADAVVGQVKASLDLQAMAMSGLLKGKLPKHNWPTTISGRGLLTTNKWAEILNRQTMVPLIVQGDAWHAKMAAFSGHLAVNASHCVRDEDTKPLAQLPNLLFRLVRRAMMRDRGYAVEALRGIYRTEVYRRKQPNVKPIQRLMRDLAGWQALPWIVSGMIEAGMPFEDCARHYVVRLTELLEFGTHLGLTPAAGFDELTTDTVTVRGLSVSRGELQVLCDKRRVNSVTAAAQTA